MYIRRIIKITAIPDSSKEFIIPNLLMSQITITDADMPISGNVYYYSNV